MSDRNRLVSTLWITSTLALLASLLIAPVRRSERIGVSPRPECLLRGFVLPSGQPTTCLDAAMTNDAVLEIDALPSEGEEQDRVDALHVPRMTFLIPCSFRIVPDRQSIAPRSTLSHYPLRC